MKHPPTDPRGVDILFFTSNDESLESLDRKTLTKPYASPALRCRRTACKHPMFMGAIHLDYLIAEYVEPYHAELPH